MGLPKGQQVPSPHKQPLWYSTEEHDQAVFDQPPNWLQEQIQNRIREQSKMPDKPAVSEFEDDSDIPF